MPNAAGGFDKIPQLGNVIIEDDVELGANTCVDRAKTDSTIIRRGVKLDNLVQVGHNVQIGENTVSSAQTGIAGTSKVGANCFLAGQVGIADHVTIGDRVKIGSKSGLDKDVPDDEIRFGYPALPGMQYHRSAAIFKILPEMARELRELRKTVEELKTNRQEDEKLSIFAAAALLLCSCASKNKYVIEGNVAGLEGKVYLFDRHGNLLDSAAVEAGAFRFEGVAAHPDIRTIADSADPQQQVHAFATMLFLEPGNIAITQNETEGAIAVSGTPSNDAYAIFNAAIKNWSKNTAIRRPRPNAAKQSARSTTNSPTKPMRPISATSWASCC